MPPVGGEVGLVHDAGGVKGSGDDAHGLLRVVATVSEAVGSGGNELQFAEKLVDLTRGFAAEKPGNSYHHAEA